MHTKKNLMIFIFVLCNFITHACIGLPMKIQIIVGSVRHTPTGQIIGQNIKEMADKRSEITTEIVNVSSYNLPFYTDPIAPESQKGEITDPLLKKWSEKIKEADGYIIISPVYNHGYPGPLKNALDSLYVEWNDKPVAFVGYSGGMSGGKEMIEQLRQVAKDGLKMIPVATEIAIPQSWKALDKEDKLIKPDLEQELNLMIDQLLAINKSKQNT
jgi:NAD(P)H-dependent FMN reductase